MKKYLIGLLGLGLFGTAFAYVDISAVTAKYKEPTQQNMIDFYQAESVKHAIYALQLSARLGYTQCAEDYGIKLSTETQSNK